MGYGSDFEYRYALNRVARGQWFVSYLQQTTLPNVSGVTDTGQSAKEARALITGTHTQQVTQDLLLRINANLVSDPQYLQQLSNSGAQRALPSNESNLFANQRLRYGNTYLLGQYLQPLLAGGPDTFQRLPEVGYSLPKLSLFNSPSCSGETPTRCISSGRRDSRRTALMFCRTLDRRPRCGPCGGIHASGQVS